MSSKKKGYYAKGFTITEVLVTLAITSIAITLSYSTLTYIQKLLYNYKAQNKFINEYTDLKKRLDYESAFAHLITEQKENTFLMQRDSATNVLEILDKTILIWNKNHCDTFHIEAKKVTKVYELMKNPAWANRLVQSIEFETEFTKQKFNFYFYKKYDASVKLELDKTE